MLSFLRPSLVMLVAMTLLTGIAYPLAMTGIAQVVFPDQANGSLVVKDGRVVGSSLVAQDFTGQNYFHPRPSAATYDGGASGGSNLGPTSKALVERVGTAAAKLSRENDGLPVPIDLVTTSGSGLDPDISPAAALVQARRVAAARGLPIKGVRDLVRSQVEGRDLGLLGEPRVNVLALNMALDALSPPAKSDGGAPAPDGAASGIAGTPPPRQ